MKLAILDTVPKSFWPLDEGITDGQKFMDWLKVDMPDWEMEIFYVSEMPTPGLASGLTSGLTIEHNWGGFDGFLITGSPMSVHDDLPWIPHLEQFIRALYQARVKLAGFCFGHQLIAKALGGEVKANERGWLIGLYELETEITPKWMATTPTSTRLYHFNKERVHTLPRGAKSFASCEGYEHFGYVIDDHIMAIQGHPEQPRRAMKNFFNALVEGSDDSDWDHPEFVSQVHQRIDSGQPDSRLWAKWSARFFGARF